MRSRSTDVIIVGGGIAGISAALILAESGVRVLLLETRRKLGGRATSFEDVRTGETIDNCQHVALGCCTNYIDLCERLGVLDKIQWHESIWWIEAGGRTSVMRPGILPSPAHYSGAFLAAKFLSTAEKVEIARAMGRILRTDRRDASIVDQTFGGWLRDNCQSDSAIEKFWAPVIVSACNLNPSRVSASSAMHVIQEGFLATRSSAVMGVSAVPLVELYDRAESVIGSAGGEIRLGVSVSSINENSIITAEGATIEADQVISAVPAERLAKFADTALANSDERIAMASNVEHSPILGVHLVFDRPVMSTPNAVLVERDTQWLFRKDRDGRKVHAVISAADDWMKLDEEAIRRRVLGDIHTCLPGSRHAKLISVRSVKEKRATFAPTPEFERNRPSTIGSSRLILAGDWVDTGWPGTMEGATRSGYMAAAATDAIGSDLSTYIVVSQRPGLFVRLLGSPGLRDQDQIAMHITKEGGRKAPMQKESTPA